MLTDGTVNVQKVNRHPHGKHREMKSGFAQENITHRLKAVHANADYLIFSYNKLLIQLSTDHKPLTAQEVRFTYKCSAWTSNLFTI